MEPTNVPVAQGSKAGPKNIVLIIVVILVIGVLAWWFIAKKPSTAPQPAAPGTVNQPTQSLGGQIYNQASNPVSGNLPSTGATVPNPIQGLYKNPF